MRARRSAEHRRDTDPRRHARRLDAPPDGRRRRPRRQAYPDTVEASYVAALTRIVDRIYAAVVPVVLRAFEATPRDDVREDADDPYSVVEAELSITARRMIPDPRSLTDPTAEQLELFQGRQTQRLIESVATVDPLRSEPWLEPVMETWSRANTNLITSLPERCLNDVEVAVNDAWRRGLSTADLQKQLEERHGISRRRAELIARDQVGKLNGQLTATRQAAAGIERYRWRTSRDPRVRQSHADREGEEFSWAESPEDGHPGQAINCRCSAEPLLDDLLSDEGLSTLGTPEHAERVRRTLGDAVEGLVEGVPGGDAIVESVNELMPTTDEILEALQDNRPPSPATQRVPRAVEGPRLPRAQRRPRGRPPGGGVVPVRPAPPPLPVPGAQGSPARPPGVQPRPAVPVQPPSPRATYSSHPISPPVPLPRTIEEGIEVLARDGVGYGEPSELGMAWFPKDMEWGPRLGAQERIVQVGAIAEALRRLKGTRFERIAERVVFLDRPADPWAAGMSTVGRNEFSHRGERWAAIAIRPFQVADPIPRPGEPGFTTWTWSARLEDKLLHTVRHELAHANTTDELVREWARVSGEYGPMWFRANVSEYAGLDASRLNDDHILEQIAECFAWMTSGAYTHGSVLKPFEALLMSMIRP